MNKKYRPAFSADEIKHLNQILKVAYLDNMIKLPYHPDVSADPSRAFDLVVENSLVSLMAKISTLQSKVQNDAIAPAYIAKDPRDVATLASLGASSETLAVARGQQTKEQYWEDCHTKYCFTPEECTVPEIEAAQEHRYLHDLMSPNEVEVFEARKGDNS